MIKNLDQLIEDLTADFNPKQKKVVFARFGLKTGRRSTLQEIGDELGVTRERVRQIEEDCIKRLTPKTQSEASSLIEFASRHLKDSGGVRRDDYLVRDVASHFLSDQSIKYAEPKLRFVFLMAGTPFYSRESDELHAYWYAGDEVKNKFSDFVKDVKNSLEEGGGLDFEGLRTATGVSDLASTHFLLIPKFFGQNVFGDFGLRNSPMIEPKTIRDKIYLVLKKRGEPLHFEEIAKSIAKLGLSRKQAHVQTVHNELIKDGRFVLVGRGIYALGEQGYEPGTVREVIARLLKKNGPLVSSDVVRLVNEQRFLKENTILLSLQNRRFFKRLEDGRYHLREV